MIANGVGHHEDVMLGGILADAAMANRYMPQVRGDMFVNPLRRAIFDAACVQHAEHGAIAIQHLADEIDDFTREDVADELNNLQEWGQDFGNDIHMRVSAKVLAERQALSELHDGLRRLVDDGTLLTTPAEMLASMDALSKSVRGRGTCGSQTLADVMTADPADESAAESITTGIVSFDQAQPNGALQAGQKVGIAGGPGVGKTTLIETITLGALVENPDLRVVWGAGEMSLKQLRNVALSIVSGLTFLTLKQPYDRLSPKQQEEKRAAVEALRTIGSRLTFIDPPLTVSRIETKVVSTGARLLVVDYLQLMKCESKAAQSRRDAVDHNLHELIRIANQHSCAFIMVSDMPKHERGRRPDMFSAFKETSEAIYGLDSAYVLEPIGVDADDDGESELPGVVDVRLRCLKQRFGRRQSIAFRFDQPTRQFTGLRG